MIKVFGGLRSERVKINLSFDRSFSDLETWATQHHIKLQKTYNTESQQVGLILEGSGC